jgi:hypothetical protein
MTSFPDATADFEDWLARHTPLDGKDLAYKHKQMTNDRHAFPFFRATFYRWAQLWPEVCPDLAAAPAVLAVGDLHVENFGTWRDADGRLVWGVNDFDEAARLSYANDLVRLAVSVALVGRTGTRHLRIDAARACRHLLLGYADQLTRWAQDEARPFVLEEHNRHLRRLAMSEARNPVTFWAKLGRLLRRKEATVPGAARAIIRKMLPEADLPCALRRRRKAGLGSLGKPRFVGLATWRGGLVAREAKALTPSACAWAEGSGDATTHYRAIVEGAVRCPDPFLHVGGGWLVRRLAPHCSRINLDHLAGVKDVGRLLRAMGRETANVHLGSADAVPRILHDLRRRPSGWLLEAVGLLEKATRKDWKAWRRCHGRVRAEGRA